MDISKARLVMANSMVQYLTRLVLIPVALVLTYRSLPFPFSLLASICLILFFKSLLLMSKRVFKLTMALVTLPCWGFILLVFIGWDYLPSLIMISLIFSLYYWFALADLRNKRLFHPTILGATGILFTTFFMVGKVSERIPWVPHPSWCRRDFLKMSDYRALQKVFGKPLPDSFTIRKLYYPGYNLIFNGPDGYLAPWYTIAVNAPEYESLVSGLGLEASESYSAIDNMAIFMRNDSFSDAVREAYYPKQILPEWVRVYYLQHRDRKSSWIDLHADATLIVDTRTSPVLNLYVSTREPYNTLF